MAEEINAAKKANFYKKAIHKQPPSVILSLEIKILLTDFLIFDQIFKFMGSLRLWLFFTCFYSVGLPVVQAASWLDSYDHLTQNLKVLPKSGLQTASVSGDSAPSLKPEKPKVVDYSKLNLNLDPFIFLEVERKIRARKNPYSRIKTTYRTRKGAFIQDTLVGAGIPYPSPALIKIFTDLGYAKIPEANWISVTSEVIHGQKNIIDLTLRISELEKIVVEQQGKNFQAKKVQTPLKRQFIAFRGSIQRSIYQDAADAGVPSKIVSEFIKLVGYNIDFQRDIQKGDIFEIVIDAKTTPNQNYFKEESLVFARLKAKGKDLILYGYNRGKGKEFFDADGKSNRKTFMRTPIDGARMSSGFGRRRHPILGYNKMHTGIDFAAPTGTRVFASGDGVVSYAAPKGGYGNYLMIKHNAVYTTAYAHLSRYAKGIKQGTKVRQGQVVAFVGTTGRSTGPHLHYEVLQNGQYINPNNLKILSTNALIGADRARFLSLKSSIEQARKKPEGFRMKSLIFVLFFFCLAALVVVLFTGLVGMARGGDFNQKYGNRLMWWRIYLQGAALILFLILVYLKVQA